MIERSQRKLVGWCMLVNSVFGRLKQEDDCTLAWGVSGKSEILMHKDQTKQSAKQ